MEAFTMRTLFKIATAAALTGALALAAVSPSQARDGRNGAAAIGFGAGAIAGAAAASAANNGYYYGDPGYVDPGYAYGPAYGSDYAYVPAPTYYGPHYRYGRHSCAGDLGYGRQDYASC
jgi:hypothetical protein